MIFAHMTFLGYNEWACALLTKKMVWANFNVFLLGFSSNVNGSPKNGWFFKKGVWDV